MVKIGEMVRKYQKLHQELEEISQKIEGEIEIGDKQISIDALGGIIITRGTPDNFNQINFTFDEIKEFFDFLRDKGILEE